MFDAYSAKYQLPAVNLIPEIFGELGHVHFAHDARAGRPCHALSARRLARLRLDRGNCNCVDDVFRFTTP